MARSPSPDGQAYTNPEVRFERTDVAPRGVFLFGVVLGVGSGIIALVMTWYGLYLVRAEQPRKKTDLPEARVDAERLPPEPRLEAIDDVLKDNFKPYPPRAAEILKPQERTLAVGDPKRQVLPIEQAIDELAGKLPVRKERPRAAEPPGESASGRARPGKREMKKLALVALLAAFAGIAFLLVQVVPKRTPRAAVTDIDPKKLFRPRLGADLPADAAFVDEQGRAVRLADYGKDRPFIVVPAYYRCPSLCNEVLNELVRGLRGVASYQAGRDYDVVVVSFDAREKPELARAKKAAYVEEYGRSGSEKGWHFLTGEQADIDRLLASVGYQVEWDERRQQFLHASGVVVCSPRGSVARYFSGLDYRPLYLRLALTEAGRGTISAGIMDQVLLPCFAFDETKGQYSAAVLTVVRAAGLATVGMVVVFWLMMARSAARRASKGEAVGVTGEA